MDHTHHYEQETKVYLQWNLTDEKEAYDFKTLHSVYIEEKYTYLKTTVDD